jgi:pimeloyl-ACP methyl ester carboxylesterase
MKKIFLVALLILQCTGFQMFGEIVVGVHGFLSNARSMRQVKNVLCKCGFPVCFWEYPSRQKYIGEHASHLAAKLQEIARAAPGEPISFVTHSIGALVLRAALNMPCCPQEAKCGRAVLLAPPNQGSCLGRDVRHFFPINFIMGTKTGWQLMHYDPCKIACCFGEFPPDMAVLVIAGTEGNKLFFNRPNDGYIAVEETYLNTPFYFAAFAVSHGDLLNKPEVLGCLRNFFLGCVQKPEPALCGLGRD